MPVKKRAMSKSEKRQHKMIKKALGKNSRHPLAKKILVDHRDRLPAIGNCPVTVEEGANYKEYGGRKGRPK